MTLAQYGSRAPFAAHASASRRPRKRPRNYADPAGAGLALRGRRCRRGTTPRRSPNTAGRSPASPGAAARRPRALALEPPPRQGRPRRVRWRRRGRVQGLETSATSGRPGLALPARTASPRRRAAETQHHLAKKKKLSARAAPGAKAAIARRRSSPATSSGSRCSSRSHTPGRAIPLGAASQVEVAARSIRARAAAAPFRVEDHTAETLDGVRLRASRRSPTDACGAGRSLYFRLGAASLSRARRWGAGRRYLRDALVDVDRPRVDAALERGDALVAELLWEGGGRNSDAVVAVGDDQRAPRRARPRRRIRLRRSSFNRDQRAAAAARRISMLAGRCARRGGTRARPPSASRRGLSRRICWTMAVLSIPPWMAP